MEGCRTLYVKTIVSRTLRSEGFLSSQEFPYQMPRSAQTESLNDKVILDMKSSRKILFSLGGVSIIDQWGRCSAMKLRIPEGGNHGTPCERHTGQCKNGVRGSVAELYGKEMLVWGIYRPDSSEFWAPRGFAEVFETKRQNLSTKDWRLPALNHQRITKACQSGDPIDIKERKLKLVNFALIWSRYCSLSKAYANNGTKLQLSSESEWSIRVQMTGYWYQVIWATSRLTESSELLNGTNCRPKIVLEQVSNRST